MTSTVVLATHNPGKVRELRKILAEVLQPEQVVSAGEFDIPDVQETGVTFAENALLKARFVAHHTGLVALADDSGLSVDVLGGAPGVFSARWAGRHGDDQANLELLLAQLVDVPQDKRQAAFVCAAALATPSGWEVVEHGYLKGHLSTQPQGDGGFGYDPIFKPLGDDRTAAQLSLAEKNVISHRGRAFRELIPHLRKVV